MKIIRLGDACTKIGSGATPRGGQEVYRDDGIALIRSQNVYNDGFSRNGLAFIGDEHARQLASVTVQQNDILLNITGDSVARVCQVPADLLPARVNQHVAIIRPRADNLDAGYLRYYLASPVMQQRMLGLAAAGATRNALTKGMIENLSIPCPSLPEQRAIAAVLGALDDKIELNRRMNQTLEQMAQALFKSWFVDFAPVHANRNGERLAGLAPEVQALFPSEFEESELGLVPSGWQVGKFGDLVGFVLGGDWGKDEPSAEFPIGVYCIRGADIPDLQNGGKGKPPLRYLKSSSISKRALQSGDLVLEISGGSPTQSTGRPVLISQQLLDRFDGPLSCSNFCRLVRLKEGITPEFVYTLMRQLYKEDALLQYENGTTGIKNFAYTVFAETYDVLLPGPDVLNQFQLVVERVFAMMQSLGSQSESLAAIRDTLLPKLLSGEVRVRDAEHIVEELM